MADIPKRVIRLIDNIKLELYEEGKKKYTQIWDPTGNNTYNEGDGGPSGIKSPERSKKQASADDDNNVIHLGIEDSQIVEYYRLKAKRTTHGKLVDIKPYFTYLQDPFSETPPPKRIYGGGGLGTPEVDNVGPTPYYLNNGCKVNIKWTGKVPNPDFKLGNFSTPTEAERYNKSLKPEGPPRYLSDRPILSDIDNIHSKQSLDSDGAVEEEGNQTLRPQSEWVLETGGYDPSYTGLAVSGQQIIGFTYSAKYRDTPIVENKFVSITLPTGFTENDGKGYLEWVGFYGGTKIPLMYSTVPKGTRSFTTGIGGRGPDQTETRNVSVLNNFPEYQKDEDILKDVIKGYQVQASDLYHNSPNDYDLKVCFPDTGPCSLIPYKSPIVSLSEVGVTPSVAVNTSILTPKKVKLNVFGLPGVTSLSGETDGTIKVKVKVSLPDFTVYLGDPPGSVNSNASGLNPFGLVEDDVENPDPYEETPFIGLEDGGQNAIPLITQDEQTASQEQQKEIAEKQNTEEAVASGTEKLPDGLKSLGKYNSEFPADSTKGGEIKPGFNGVPYYQQFDYRWANVIYGTSDGGVFIEAKILPRISPKKNPKGLRVSVNWEGKSHIVYCDHCKGDNGWSDIHGGGCGITSFSMVINYWAKKGKTGGKFTSPVKMAKMACETGARPPLQNRAGKGQPPNMATSGTGPGGAFYKAIKEHFNLTAKGPVTTEVAKKLIQGGNPVVWCGSTFEGITANNKKSHTYPGHFIVFTGYDSGKWRVNDPGANVETNGISYFDKFVGESGFKSANEGRFYVVGPPDVVV